MIEFIARDNDGHHRLREIRDIGWNYKTARRKNARGKTETSYLITKIAPWPKDVDAAIKEAAAKRAKKSFRSGVRGFEKINGESASLLNLIENFHV